MEDQFRQEIRGGQVVWVRTMSPEHKAKIAAGNRGKVRSAAHKAAISRANRGRAASGGKRRAISEAKKLWWAKPENRNKFKNTVTEAWAALKTARKAQEFAPDSRLVPDLDMILVRLMLSSDAVRSAWTSSTPDVLATHLEGLFQPGMTWNNYGKWVLTWVVVPSVLAPEKYHEALHYTNLKPVWFADRRRQVLSQEYKLAQTRI